MMSAQVLYGLPSSIQRLALPRQPLTEALSSAWEIWQLFGCPLSRPQAMYKKLSKFTLRIMIGLM